MTDVACKVIVEGSAHYNASYELCGPDKLTNDDIVRILSRATGREVRVDQRTIEDLFKILWPDYGDSEKYQDEIDVITSISKWYGQYDYIGNPRSEEHTSELQSLMRISYAVFCLKKK